MQPLNVALLQCDPNVAKSLASRLSLSFPSIRSTHSLDNLQSSIARHRSAVAILDLEMISMSDLQRLCHHFSDMKVIRTYRLADEDMLKRALDAGAIDVFPSNDASGVASSAVRSTSAPLP